jgi:hypothetical protein
MLCPLKRFRLSAKRRRLELYLIFLLRIVDEECNAGTKACPGAGILGRLKTNVNTSNEME